MSYSVEYEHFVPKAPPNPDFPDKYCRVLIRSIDELKEALSHKGHFMSFDLETSDLDPTKGFIVGYSFSFDGITGYYVPIKHVTGTCFGKEALDILYERMKSLKKTFLANVRFDYRFMEYTETMKSQYGYLKACGYDMSVIPYYDVLVGVFLADTNKPMPSLKWAANHFLGWDVNTFEETLGDNYNFYYLDPEDAYEYAASDAIMTFALANATVKYFSEAKMSGKLDNEFLYPLMKYEDNPIRMDVDYLSKLLQEQSIHLREIEQEIYRQFGYSFKIGSGKQLSEAFQRIGLDTGKYVKAGYMKTDIKTIEDLEIKTKHPVLKILIEYKQLTKAVGSYTETLLKYAQEKEGRLRFAYHNLRVPTCRLACGADGKNTFYAKINEQSIPKPHSTMWYVYPYKEGDKVYPTDEIVLGYRFSLEDKSSKVWVEGANPKGNLRKAFLPEEGHYWLSVDYAAQELRAIANYSKEPTWVNTFNTGGDLHKNMAIGMWGKENYDKDKRKKAKVLNFGMAYGMNEYSLSEKFRVPLEEATDIKNRFWKAVPRIQAMQKAYVAKARKEGTVYNYFGRPRRVKFYMKHADSKKRAFGARTVNNTVIQSVGADLLKIALIKLWKNMYNHEDYKDYCRFLSTIHDEVNSSVEIERAEELTRLQSSLMVTQIPNWPVKFEVGIELGNSWGATFPFHFEDGKLVPSIEDVPEDKQEKDEEVEEIVEEEEDFSFDLDL